MSIYAVKNNKASVGSGYKTLAEQLINFSELGHMPIDVDIPQGSRFKSPH